jgi:uncharacterized protein YjhX (UPF0386 family)
MATRVNPDKLAEVSKLNRGDIIKLKSGEEVEFIRLKRKKFLGIIDGTTYNIHVNSFNKVLEEAEDNTEENINKLESGDYFYIESNRGGNALLFKFKRMKNNKIIGINPISNSRTRIDKALFVDKVK